MITTKNVALLGLIISLFSMTGCASKVYKTDSLNKTNRYAIVTVTGRSTGFGMSEKDEIELLTSVEKVVAKELKEAQGFQLVDSAKVIRNSHYKAIKGESTDGLMSMKAAKGFKNFEIENEKEAVAGLRKDMKLAGVIQVITSVKKKSGGMWISGILPIPVPLSAGSTQGEVVLVINAFDSNNEVVWHDVIEMETKDSVGTVMGISNLSSLYPQLIDAIQVAANTAVTDLNNELK